MKKKLDKFAISFQPVQIKETVIILVELHRVSIKTSEAFETLTLIINTDINAQQKNKPV